MPAERFTVELQRVGKTGASFEVPLDVRALFGRARPPVNAFTNRREYADWIAEAKREGTRWDRTQRAVAMLREGKKHP